MILNEFTIICLPQLTVETRGRIRNIKKTNLIFVIFAMCRGNNRLCVYGNFNLSCRKLLFFFVSHGQLTHTRNFFARKTSEWLHSLFKRQQKLLGVKSVPVVTRYHQMTAYNLGLTNENVILLHGHFVPEALAQLSERRRTLLLLLLTLIPELLIIIFTWWMHQTASHDVNFKVTLGAVHVCTESCLQNRNYSYQGGVSEPETSEKQQHLMFGSLWHTTLTHTYL